MLLGVFMPLVDKFSSIFQKIKFDLFKVSLKNFPWYSRIWYSRYIDGTPR